MWTFFFILGFLGILILMFYLIIELNGLEKKIITLGEEIRKHYEDK